MREILNNLADALLKLTVRGCPQLQQVTLGVARVVWVVSVPAIVFPARNGDGAGGPPHTNGPLRSQSSGRCRLAVCTLLACYTLISTSLREIGAEYNYFIIMSSTTWHQFVIKVVKGIFYSWHSTWMPWCNYGYRSVEICKFFLFLLVCVSVLFYFCKWLQ